MKIGVFDSGIGGLAVAEELRRLLPQATVITASDPDHVPYGGRPRSEIMQLTKTAIQPLIAAQCDAIVIACNTATTNAIQLLRHDYPTQKFVGLEPMVKPAALLTQTKAIAVLATPATLKSPRYQALKADWATGVTIYEPDCSTWAERIEASEVDSISLEETLFPLLDENVDVVVLGCTHYHWLKERIQTIVGPTVHVLEPSNAIKNRIADIVG